MLKSGTKNKLRAVSIALMLMLSGILHASSIKNEALNNAAEKYELLFFYRGHCPHCHHMAPSLLTMAETYGFAVVANRYDGPQIDGFSMEVSDKALFDDFKVAALPTLVLMDKKTHQGIVISNYAVHGAQLELKVLEGAANLGELLA